MAQVKVTHDEEGKVRVECRDGIYGGEELVKVVFVATPTLRWKVDSGEEKGGAKSGLDNMPSYGRGAGMRGTREGV
jgi:hypothetical protein